MWRTLSMVLPISLSVLAGCGRPLLTDFSLGDTGGADAFGADSSSHGGVSNDGQNDPDESAGDEPDPPDSPPDPPDNPPGDPPDTPPGGGDMPPCAGELIVDEGFEDAGVNWQLDALFWVVPDDTAYAGEHVLWGDWVNFDVGCPAFPNAALALDVDLTDSTEATLRFAHTGAACSSDTLRVEVRSEAGADPFTLPTPVPLADSWSTYEADLTQWLGVSSVRITIGFDNVCGDPCGVSWKIDEVTVCG